MNDAMKVFKIPDGKGGIIFKVQTPDGEWHETDEQGNFLPVKEEPQAGSGQEAHAPGPSQGIPKEKKRTSPGRSRKDEGSVNLSVRFSKEEYKELSDYVYWRCIYKEVCSKASFLLNLGLDAISKDREYREFRKKL